MTFEDIKKIIVETLSVDENKVTPDAKLVEDLGADSLDAVELMMELEEKCNVQIPDDEATKITTVNSIVELVNSLKR